MCLAELARPGYGAAMSTAELVADKMKSLPDFQAEAVLTFVQELEASPSLSATEVMRLPLSERRRILANQARQAESVYR